MTGEWRKLHNEELHGLYDSPDVVKIMKSRRLRWAGHIARMGEKRRLYSILVGRPDGRKPFGRPRRRWEDNIRRDLREIGVRDENWLDVAQDRIQWRTFVIEYCGDELASSISHRVSGVLYYTVSSILRSAQPVNFSQNLFFSNTRNLCSTTRVVLQLSEPYYWQNNFSIYF